MKLNRQKIMTDILSDKILASAKKRRTKLRIIYTTPIVLILAFTSIRILTPTASDTQTINKQNQLSRSNNQEPIKPSLTDDELLIEINNQNLFLTFEPITKPKYTDTKILEMLSK